MGDDGELAEFGWCAVPEVIRVLARISNSLGEFNLILREDNGTLIARLSIFR
jgi:hypothetical protein